MVYRSRSQAGFTLVEVIVALAIMAIMAVMAWRGVDALVRTRDGGQAATERTLKLQTALAQWEQDLAQLQATPDTPTLRFDGAALRLTRRTPDGLQIVVWTRQDGALQRWATPPLVRAEALQEWWLRSLQWPAIQADALRLVEDVSDWQVYYFQPGDVTWSNALSSGNVSRQPKPPTPPPTPKTPPPAEGGGNGEGGSDGGGGTGSGSGSGIKPATVLDVETDTLPIGVRVVLTLPSGQLVRDVRVTPAL